LVETINIIPKGIRGSLAMILAASALSAAPLQNANSQQSVPLNQINAQQTVPVNHCEAPAKEASGLEKVVVGASGLYLYKNDPLAAVFVGTHEIMHKAAASIVGAGSKKTSVLPTVYSDQNIKDFLKGEDLLNLCKNVGDYSKIALALNSVNSFMRFKFLSGEAGYFIPGKEPSDMTTLQNLAVAFGPRAADIIIISLLKGKGGSHQRFTGYTLSSAESSVFSALLGDGDMAHVARTILPPKKYDRWYHYVARGTIGGAVAYELARIENKIAGYPEPRFRIR